MVRRHVCVRRVSVSFGPMPVSFPEAVDKWSITESDERWVPNFLRVRGRWIGVDFDIGEEDSK
jgi:hypothetical protein